MEKGQTRLCKFSHTLRVVIKKDSKAIWYFGNFVLLGNKKKMTNLMFHTTFAQVVWLGTCIASILLGLDLGLAVGLGVELVSVVVRTQL